MVIEKLISWLALLSGLSISGVAIYYSVSGLVSIFSTAAMSIIVMGTSLEIGKLVATIWLKRFWKVVPLSIKTYLISAIIILMMITSLGTFGFISRAHMDQSIPSGAVKDQLEIIDSKIVDSQNDIEMAKKSLAQMDATVEETMSRTTTDKGALKSLKIRQSQKDERDSIKHQIEASQRAIQVLKEERFPLSQQLKKVEAEFGPITYIAALLYRNPEDKGKLEEAVRFVIILIVIVFDPLAITLILASQFSFKWIEDNKKSLPILNNDTIIENHPQENRDDEIESMEPEFTPDDDIDSDDGDKYSSEKYAKTRWKSENKEDTIKRQEMLHSLGLTDKLPWDK